MLDGARRLDEEDLVCRRMLFLLIFQIQRPLKITEVADALSLRADKVQVIISRLCKPLASTYDGYFHLSHPSVREFFELYYQRHDSSLGVSFSGSHEFLAKKCLSCLQGDRYANLSHIGTYLQANHDEDVTIDVEAHPPADSFYDYASQF